MMCNLPNRLHHRHLFVYWNAIFCIIRLEMMYLSYLYRHLGWISAWMLRTACIKHVAKKGSRRCCALHPACDTVCTYIASILYPWGSSSSANSLDLLYSTLEVYGEVFNTLYLQIRFSSYFDAVRKAELLLEHSVRSSRL
jgi:hypothetical protein